MRRLICIWFLLCGMAFGQQKISDLPPITAADIADDAAVFFGLDNTGDNLSYKMSFEELKHTGVEAVNVKQLGCIGDGAVDDTVDFQAAVDAVPTGGTLFVPDGIYRVTGIDITKPITIYGPGVLKIDADEYGLNIDFASLWGAAQQVTNITTVSTSGATLPQVSSCTVAGHGLAVGDVIKLCSSGVMAIGSNDYYGEIFRVTKVVDVNTFWINRVALANFTDTGSQTVYIRKMPAGRLNLDVTFDVVPGSENYDRNSVGSNHGPLVTVTGAVEPVINITALKSYGTVLQAYCLFGGEINVRASNVDVPRLPGNTANVVSRVVSLGGGCNGTSVRILSSGGLYGFYNEVYPGAATFDTSTTTFSRSGLQQNILVHDSYVSNVAHTAYYNGGGHRSTHFDNCVVKDVQSLDSTVINDSSNGFGFKDGSDGTRYTGCFVDGARIALDTDNGSFWTDIAMTVTDFRCTNCSYAGLFLQTQGLPTVINGYECSSPCTAIRLSFGRYHIRNVTVTNLVDYNASPFTFDGGSTSTWDNITILGGADAEPPFQVDGGCYVILRNIWLDRAIDEDPVALILANDDCTIDVDTVHFTGEPYPDGDGYNPAAFPPQGLIATASLGTVTLASDSFRGSGRRHQYATSAPVGEAHRLGDIVWNSNPTAGGTMGWICTAAGTPGTWKTFGAISP